ncbi:flagellar export protein FliJ [bacterium (Candidatus Blackallbacteria) CG17_big_fil_post_rev_8_21_14_2_50_48_46]|uniref:Flagellar FliJ protein n=1 Tax=bacterium (Candidatus Blackallbacteria) CG17_big_fil_post_rev_8_21_14_2_50_48_46 TaxID=2014261 RepID=A0A2M7G7V0_9BACT|nr:MAG: flagellar export protein FliJ [bacterium (Candidatus Blackallbacteria) CG18_big_fil_WC_8_21_14_2_50_49_26]PIW18129.1 MAG: flagellar export protein FliJ [bacterium (Candidatus Blackallbacteria) CG17_big_fil_post_rev_8_21_14_2_50_48_46]PIW51138.1 MAG: flagellar export protein FliJ [bacterium (Candidatus Blackallbacteria) CG13_big_fil_rev_8_21_14_2_50_49_14]
MAGKKFQYRLEKVLDFRTKKVEQLQAELALAIRDRDTEVAMLNALSEKRTKAQKSLEGYLSRGEVAEVQQTNTFLENLAKKLESQTRIVSKMNESVELIRKKLVVASKEKKIMEKHKEKKHEEWKVEMGKIEAKQLDEMAGTIFRKNLSKKALTLEEEERRQEVMEKQLLIEALKAKKKKH